MLQPITRGVWMAMEATCMKIAVALTHVLRQYTPSWKCSVHPVLYEGLALDIVPAHDRPSPVHHADGRM